MLSHSAPCSDPTLHFFVILLSSTIFAIAAVAQDSFSDTVAITLTSAKATYSASDPVALTITLENRSPRAITINKRMAHPGPDLMIDIEDVLGNKFRWLPSSPPPLLRRKDFTVLGPGQKLAFSISDLEIGLYDKFETDHTYRVKVRYQNTEDGHEFSYAAWTGSVTSNGIMFKWRR
jgi:hypothetical protein